MSEESTTEIRGRTKAAILLGFLPKEIAIRILVYLDNLEKEILIKELSVMPRYEVDVIEEVLVEYISYIKGNNYGIINSGLDYALGLIKDIPEEEFKEMMGRIYSNNTRPFDSFKKLRDVSQLMTFLHNEDPQTIAVVISHLNPSQAAEIIQSLGDEKRAKVAMAIAKMDQTNKEILLQIERHLVEKLEKFVTSDKSQTDGIKTLVGILNNVTRATEKSLFERLDYMEPQLSEEIKNNMFVFEDLVKLDRIALQKVVNKITDNNLVALALRGSTEEMKERFYQSMPDQRKALLKDADEGLNQVRKSDVEEAQQKIANVVKELEKSKEIFIQRGEEDVIL